MWSRLYKYSPINKYALDSIQNNYLVYSSPYDFNDPLDCQLSIEHRDAALVQDRWMEASLSETIQDEKLLSSLKTLLIGEEEETTKNFAHHVIEKTIRAMRITCFSESNVITPMWAHYAKDHSGMCLEFTFPSDQAHLFSYVAPVRYSDECPVLIWPAYRTEDFGDETLIKAHEEMLMSLVLTKERSWAYEREQRIIFSEELGTPITPSKNAVSFPETALSAIYFGLKTNRSSIDEVIAACSHKQSDLAFFQLARKRQSFSYEFVPLS